jgi:hypothetical protein
LTRRLADPSNDVAGTRPEHGQLTYDSP